MDSNKKVGLALAVGAAAGWAATLLMSDSQKLKQRKALSDLGSQVTDTELAQRIQETYKETTDEARSKYENVRDSVMSAVGNLQENFDDIDFRKYADTVAEALEELREKKQITKAQLDRLQSYFEADFNKLRNGAQKTARKARRTAKTIYDQDQPRA